MNLSESLKKVTEELFKKNIPFALAGGIVASYYRKYPRATKDIDILIFVENSGEETAERIIKNFKLEPHYLRKADLEGGPMFAIKRKSTPVCIIAGRPDVKSDSIGLDFMLPSMPWSKPAFERAQSNNVDFGFGPIPCLTIEDMIIAKLYAVKNQSTRFMDLDDLKSFFEAKHELNLSYIGSQMRSLEIKIPKNLKQFVPKELWLISK